MIYYITQYFAAIVSLLLLKVFTNFRVVGSENLTDARKPLIIVSNHESHLDPQLLGVAMLHKPSLYPLRYMTKNEFFLIPIFNLLIWLLGSFKANRGQGLHRALITPQKILAKNGSVIMFPEGKIIFERGTLGRPKRGAAALAIMTKAAILPVSLHTPHGLTPVKFLFARRSSKNVVVNIGEPFYLDNVTYPDVSDEITQKATDEIMLKIESLYNQHSY